MSEGKKKFSLHRMGTISERSVVKQRKPITSTSSLENKSILLGLLSPEIPVVQTKTLSVPLDDTKDKPQQFYQTSLQFIFNAMGFTEEQTSKCMTKIDSEMTARQHKAIQNQTFLSPIASKEIKQLQLKINSVLEKQEQAEAAIRLQSLVRGHLLRKKFSKYTPEAKKRLKLWTGSFSQILLLEKRYLGKLQLLKQYLAPLEPTNNVMPGTENTAHYLQSNFQRLLETHEILLEDLEALANSPGFPFSSRLGACLLENFSRIGPAYMTYAKNYQASMEVLDYYSNNIPQFLGLLEEIGSSSLNGYKKLKSLLQWPVEHLAALETKLNSIYTYYEDIENDREKLSRVITTLGFSSDITQTQINQQGLPAQLANIKKILAVEYQLEPLEKPLNLLAWSSRKLLKDGAMKINGKRNMQIYLFSDLVLITEKLVNSIRFVQTVELHKANIIRESDKDFVLITDTKETGTQCHCSSKSETADWIGKITSIIDNYSSHRIYGIPLTELILREKQPDGIPRVLKQTLGWVAKNAQDIEGIFRVPGDASVIGEYKVLYDCGMSKDIDFSLCSAHDVAGLCKLYLRELPEPLFPHDSYDKIVNTEQERENQQEEDVEGYTRKLADIVREVPKDRRKVLQFVLMFLKEFSVHSKQTKMTVENLSMVFSPNLVRPVVDTMDTAMKSPMITKFITFLIQNHEEVWEVASEGETIAAKEELASVQKLVQGLLQQDAVSLDDLMAIKASRPSQYIDLQSPSSPRGRESPRVAKAGSKKRHSLTKKSNLTPKKQEKDTPPLRDDPSPRYRKKKSHSFKLRRANTLTH